MMGGQVDSFFATASPLVNQVRQGQLRLLAITGNARNPAIPDVPTFKELGVKRPREPSGMAWWHPPARPSRSSSTWPTT